ncbi:MAG: hypothetical protein AAGA03_13370 [Planctomycetota bacterium]
MTQPTNDSSSPRFEPNEAFAKQAKQLRPARSSVDPSELFYQAGYQAAIAQMQSNTSPPTRLGFVSRNRPRIQDWLTVVACSLLAWVSYLHWGTDEFASSDLSIQATNGSSEHDRYQDVDPVRPDSPAPVTLPLKTQFQLVNESAESFDDVDEVHLRLQRIPAGQLVAFHGSMKQSKSAFDASNWMAARPLVGVIGTQGRIVEQQQQTTPDTLDVRSGLASMQQRSF